MGELPARFSNHLVDSRGHAVEKLLETKLSADGTWLAYALTPQDGDGELVVRNLKTNAEIRARISGLGSSAIRPVAPSAAATTVVITHRPICIASHRQRSGPLSRNNGDATTGKIGRR